MDDIKIHINPGYKQRNSSNKYKYKSFKEKCDWVESHGGKVFGMAGLPYNRKFILKNGHKMLVEELMYKGYLQKHILIIVLDNIEFGSIGVMYSRKQINTFLSNHRKIFKAYYMPKNVILENIYPEHKKIINLIS